MLAEESEIKLFLCTFLFPSLFCVTYFLKADKGFSCIRTKQKVDGHTTFDLPFLP